MINWSVFTTVNSHFQNKSHTRCKTTTMKTFVCSLRTLKIQNDGIRNAAFHLTVFSRMSPAAGSCGLWGPWRGQSLCEGRQQETPPLTHPPGQTASWDELVVCVSFLKLYEELLTSDPCGLKGKNMIKKKIFMTCSKKWKVKEHQAECGPGPPPSAEEHLRQNMKIYLTWTTDLSRCSRFHVSSVGNDPNGNFYSESTGQHWRTCHLLMTQTQSDGHCRCSSLCTQISHFSRFFPPSVDKRLSEPGDLFCILK